MQQDAAVPRRGKRKQRVDVACDFCRKRKLGCDNAKPNCGSCDIYGRDCAYTPQSRKTSSIQVLGRQLTHDPTVQQSLPLSPRHSRVGSTPQDSRGSARLGASFPPRAGQYVLPHEEVNSLSSSREPVFHGPTSAMFEEAWSSPRNPVYSAPEAGITPDSIQRNQLLAETARQRQLEVIHLHSQRLNFGQVDPELGMKLLSIFWKRQVYTGPIVYRPYFMRDMVCRGPYHSELLLNAILFVASKLDPVSQKPLSRLKMFQSGQHFQDTFNKIMYDQNGKILFKTSIPTIQALLLISDNIFAAQDQPALSWQYLGIAINMIIDLGIHTDRSLPTHGVLIPLEDVETRRRVFWTAFVLDKIQALYQGRAPRLRDMDTNVPLVFFDDFDELEPFHPFGFTPTSDTYGAVSHCMTTFEQFCRLGIIIDHILGGLYAEKVAHGDPRDLWQKAQNLYGELTRWREALPVHLAFCFDTLGDVDTSRGFVALPHTLCQSLMFFSMLILIHRPFLSDGHLNTVSKSVFNQSLSICKTSAEKMDSILRLYKNRWNIKAPPYFLSYATYVSGTIHVRMAANKPRGSLSHQSLRNCLEILSSHQDICPAAQRCLGILKNLANLLRVRIDDDTEETGPQCSNVGAPSSRNRNGLHADARANIGHLSALDPSTNRTLTPNASEKTRVDSGTTPQAAQNFISNGTSGDMILGHAQNDQLLYPGRESEHFGSDMQEWFAGVSFDLDPIFGIDSLPAFSFPTHTGSEFQWPNM